VIFCQVLQVDSDLEWSLIVANCFRYEVESYDDNVNTWFSEAIGRHCTFMRCSSSKNRSCSVTGKNGRLCRDTRSKLSFVNEGQLLLISEESVSDLNSRLSSSMQFSFPVPYLLIKDQKDYLFIQMIEIALASCNGDCLT
jgi:uncharacterized protein YcbX